MSSIQEIEEFVLSALMNAADPEAFEEIVCAVSSRDFGIPGHSDLFDAIVLANDATDGEDRGPSMIWSQLMRQGLHKTLEKWGIDKAAIAQIHGYGVKKNSGIEYAHIVKEEGSSRRLATAGAQIIEIARSKKEFDVKMVEADRLLSTALEDHNEGISHIRDSIDALELELLGVNANPFLITPSHIPYMDRVLEGGFRTDTINYFTGPSSHGKSSICINIGANMALYEADRLVVAWAPIEEGVPKLRVELASYWSGHGPWLLDEEMPQDRPLLSFSKLSSFRSGAAQPTLAEALEIRNAMAILRHSNIEFMHRCIDRKSYAATLRRIRRRNPEKIIVDILDYMNMMGKEGGESTVDHMEELTIFLRHSLNDDHLMAGRGIHNIVVQLRGDANPDPGSIEEGDRPSKFYDMTYIKGASAVHQSGDTVWGTLITARADANGASLRADRGHRLHIDVLKNKVTPNLNGGIFYQNRLTRHLTEA